MAEATVLIVDDAPGLRRTLRLSLAALDFEAMEADTGEQALAFLGNEHFDVVLLDIDMSGMGGIETVDKFKNYLMDLPF
jgi:CheY-like chemotaxis protein